MLLQLKITVFYLNVFEIVNYSCDAKLNFQHHNPSLLIFFFRILWWIHLRNMFKREYVLTLNFLRNCFINFTNSIWMIHWTNVVLEYNLTDSRQLSRTEDFQWIMNYSLQLYEFSYWSHLAEHLLLCSMEEIHSSLEWHDRMNDDRV